MDGWKALADYPDNERTKLRWLLRGADENGIVAEGVAIKFGREWRINTEKLPAFLGRLTLRQLPRRSSAA